MNGALLVNDPGNLDRATMIQDRGTDRYRDFQVLVAHYYRLRVIDAITTFNPDRHNGTERP
jgi:hypothetical protein